MAVGTRSAVARSADGEHFELLTTIHKEDMAADSLERPYLVRTPEGTWRLYLSCATPGTKHWRVEVIEAAHPAQFDSRRSQVVLPGDSKKGVKDPVIVRRDGKWHMWVTCHPLDDPTEADQMATEYATSPDGLTWTWNGVALNGRPGHWDSRGARVTSVCFSGDIDRGLLRRPGDRRRELRGTDRCRDGHRAIRAQPHWAPGPWPGRRTTGAACATWTFCRCRMAASGSTTR